MTNSLRLFRQQTGLSQHDLAQQVGVSRQCIIALEQGRWCPSLDLAYRLSHALDQPLHVLFPPPPPPPSTRAARPPADATSPGTLETWLL